jgi:hypothetical protein
MDVASKEEKLIMNLHAGSGEKRAKNTRRKAREKHNAPNRTHARTHTRNITKTLI